MYCHACLAEDASEHVECALRKIPHVSVTAKPTDMRHSHTAHHRKGKEKSTLHADLARLLPQQAMDTGAMSHCAHIS